MITNFIQLDFNKENDLKVPSVQYDSGSRFVKIKLQQNKVPFEINGYRVTVVANKVDGTEIMNDCTILDGANGLVEFEITEQFNAVEGVVDCQLKLFKGETLLTSMPFSINVVKSVSTKEIVSSNELKTLVNALGEVQDIDNRFAQTNAQLETKANKSEIGSPLVANSVSEMVDTTKVYVNATNGYWYSYNGNEWAIGGVYNSQGIGEKSITPDKLTIFEDSIEVLSKNLFNKNSSDIITDKTFNSTGDFKDSTTFNISHYIQVVGATKIALSYDSDGVRTRLSVAVVEYDSNYEKLAYGKSDESKGVYVIQNNSTKYIRFTYQKVREEKLQCEINDNFTEFEEYNSAFSGAISREYLPYLSDYALLSDLSNYALLSDLSNLLEKTSFDYADIYKEEIKQMHHKLCNQNNGLRFSFASDFHVEDSSEHYKWKIVRDASKHCDFICFGGDNITGDSKQPNGTRQEELDNLINIFDFNKNNVPIVSLVGNHDNNLLKSSNEYINNHAFSYLTNPNSDRVVLQNCYNSTGYIDFKEHKIRVIFINCFENFKEDGTLIDGFVSGDTINISDNTLDWIFGEAFNLQNNENWGIVLLSHAPLFGDTSYSTINCLKELHKAVNNLKTKTDYSYNGKTYKFSEQSEVKLMCHVHGHQHYDKVYYAYKNAMPCISVCCMSNTQKYTSEYVDMYTRYSPPRNYSIGENVNTECFDIITIDRNSQKIICNRFGAGYSREIPFSE